MTNVLKALGFVDENGVPKKRYHEYLDRTQSDAVLAAGIRDAYADLFRINKNVHLMSTNDVKNKMKTLSEGQFTDRVLQQMAGTFTILAKHADFSANAEEVQERRETNQKFYTSRHYKFSLRFIKNKISRAVLYVSDSAGNHDKAKSLNNYRSTTGL
jgi:uncharacterized protein with ATP-grasp and redox domains